ncbi:MAG: DUF134 domain-containing protein [Bacteroidota bacterium]|nr:DUF134 domain-containing protein [Bacteroidota bacterium]
MPRPKRIRKMTNPPNFRGFKPMGLSQENNPVVMNYEEYEAIRLSDFELDSQIEAAQAMNVSRPTFARIYESARRKVAQAFVLGSPIVFEGGKVYFDSDWYYCHSCGCWFDRPDKEKELKCCILCGSSEIEQYKGDSEPKVKEDVCICPVCGKEKIHSDGVPCHQEICPDCNCRMIRKGSPKNKFYQK